MDMKGNKLQKLTNLQHESDFQCLFDYKIENLNQMQSFDQSIQLKKENDDHIYLKNIKVN